MDYYEDEDSYSDFSDEDNEEFFGDSSEEEMEGGGLGYGLYGGVFVKGKTTPYIRFVKAMNKKGYSRSESNRLWKKGNTKVSSFPIKKAKKSPKVTKYTRDAKKVAACKKKGKAYCALTGRCRRPEAIASCYKKSKIPYFRKKRGELPYLKRSPGKNRYYTLSEAMRHLKKHPELLLYYDGKRKYLK